MEIGSILNTFAIAILAALLGAFAIDLIARLLDVRALGGELPPEFRGLYDPDAYARSQEYARARTRFRLLESTVWLAALLAFWFSGGFRWADHLVRGLGLSPVPTGLLFIGLLALGSAALGLPFRAYSTFVVEEQFGFNRTTPRTFLLDLAKSAALAIAFGGPILGLILLFFERAGSSAWIYCWIAAAAFTLLAQVIYPTWILPWFNKLEPLAEGELRTAILRYAERVGFPLAGVYVIDGSRRSSRANAFFAGLGRRRRIALFDTLVERHPVPELVAVLAHEVGHYKRRHIPKMLTLRRAPLRRALLSAVGGADLAGAASSVLRRAALGRGRPGLLRPALHPGRAGDVGGAQRPVATARVPGRPLRRRDHGRRRVAGRRAQAAGDREPVEPHAAPAGGGARIVAPAGGAQDPRARSDRGAAARDSVYHSLR